jgi:hypothetical protein
MDADDRFGQAAFIILRGGAEGEQLRRQSSKIIYFPLMLSLPSVEYLLGGSLLGLLWSSFTL